MSLSNQTDRTPVSSVGSTFKRMKLVEISDLCIEFQPSKEMKAGCWIFMTFGFGCLCLSVFIAPHSLLHMAFAIFTGVLFIGVGLVMLKVFGARRVFDKRLGWYWKGAAPRNSEDVERRSDALWFKQIHAVQILAMEIEFSSVDDRSVHTNYEINLVKDDGLRVNVCAGGGDGEIYANYADSIGKFLGVPVLDARYFRKQ